MLEKVRIHQTRLEVPGVALDARGVALGARGLLLLPSLDKVVAFFAVYTGSEVSTELYESLSLEVLRSELGAREVALSFEVSSSQVLDRVAEIGRLTGGFTFTGTSRHFVQYRDAAAPFGYDVPELLANDARVCLYHSTFTQAYDLERKLDFGALVHRLSLHQVAEREVPQRVAWVLADAGLGAAWLRHLVLAGVDADVCLVSEKPVSALEPQTVQRWLFRIAELPPRLVGLLTHTPGLSLLFEEAPGVAVQYGFRHPLNLAACPVFRSEGLSLFLGARRYGGAVEAVVEPVVIEKLPALTPVESLFRPGFDGLEIVSPNVSSASALAPVRVGVSVVPAGSVRRRPVANRLGERDLEPLRRLAYVLGRRALQATRVLMSSEGLFLIGGAELDPLPLGELYSSPHPRMFVPVGWEVVPRVTPELVVEALGDDESTIFFFGRDDRVLGLDPAKFVSLEQALLEPAVWVPAAAQSFADELTVELPTLWLDSLPLRPLEGARTFEEE